MTHQDDFENSYGEETPGTRSGGLPLGVALPLVAVMIVSLVAVCILSRVKFASSLPSTVKSNSSRKQISSLFTPEVLYWEEKILSWSQAHELDPNLVATVMQIESCGYPEAKSGAGAIGLFQVMPYHFSKDENPYKPNINARKGLSYLKQALDSGDGNIRLSFAGYNGGITGATRPESTWADETKRFVYWGVGIYMDADSGKSHSEYLDEWLTAGGASLCQSAAENLGIHQNTQ